MPGGLPRIHDTPRHLDRVDDTRTAARRSALRRSLGQPRVVVVALDPAEAGAGEIVALSPLTRSLEPRPDLHGAWVRVVAQGWELEALEACEAIEGASAIEVDVSVGSTTTRSPSLDELLAAVGPRFRVAALDATHADPASGATVAASVVLVAQPST